MSPVFTRVPAIDKCFAILELLARAKGPMGISDISGKLDLNKSTVFNIGHTLTALNVLENHGDGKFGLGARFYMLANMAGKRSALIQTIHPYLDKIHEQTGLSAFLGLRSDKHAIVIDKVDSGHGLKVSAEIGLQMPVLAGAGIKAMLSLLPDQAIDDVLARAELHRFTARSVVDKAVFRAEVLKVREEGVAYDMEEFIDGVVAFAVPVVSGRSDVQAAVWAVGLTSQVPDASISQVRALLKGISEEISWRLHPRVHER